MEKDYKVVLEEMKQNKVESENTTVFSKDNVQIVEDYVEPKASSNHKRSLRHKYYHMLHKLGLIEKHESKERPRITVTKYIDKDEMEKIDLAYIKENRKI